MTSVWILYCVTVNFLVSAKFGKMVLDQLVLAKLGNPNAYIVPEVHMHKLVIFTQFSCYIYSKYVCISRLN